MEVVRKSEFGIWHVYIKGLESCLEESPAVAAMCLSLATCSDFRTRFDQAPMIPSVDGWAGMELKASNEICKLLLLYEHSF